MRNVVACNNIVAQVILEGDVDETPSGAYAARGSIKVHVRAKSMTKERFLRHFYQSLVPYDESEGSYDEVIAGLGIEFFDDVLPDLAKPAIRIYSRTLCEWNDPEFSISHYDDVWNEAGTQCGDDSPKAIRMRLGSGGQGLTITLHINEVADIIAAQLLAGRLQWSPEIDICINVLLDFQQAQGAGNWFKTLNYKLTLCPASLPLQAITLDAAAHRYRLIAGPARGPLRFVCSPSSGVQLLPDSQSVPAECASTVVSWSGATRPDLLAIGGGGELAIGYEALFNPRKTFYRIDVSGAPAQDQPFELTPETTADFDVFATKLNENDIMVPAPEATIAVEARGEHHLWSATITGEPHARYIILSIDQARGSRAARIGSETILKSANDYILRRIETLHITLTVGSLVLTRTLLVGITLPRWFPLAGSDEETHLRINYATLLWNLRNAIEQYNRTYGAPARFDVFAIDGFDKVAAGNFLFRFNASETIAKRYFFTQVDEVEKNGSLSNEWLNSFFYACPTPASRPPALTEASLLVRMIELRQSKGDKLTPGDVFGLGLEETGGEIGAAFLICHNTLRSLARNGDVLRTGITALDKDKFDKLFTSIRGGYRCRDGFAGMPKNEMCAQANFASDNAGPWYHFFGTAYFEIFTAAPDDAAPTDNRWARYANVLEQWYREYHPESWQDPDPEKEYVNCCGIAVADELLRQNL